MVIAIAPQAPKISPEIARQDESAVEDVTTSSTPDMFEGLNMESNVDLDYLSQIIEQGELKGVLDYDEVNDLLPNTMSSSSDVDYILAKFEELELEIVIPNLEGPAPEDQAEKRWLTSAMDLRCQDVDRQKLEQ